MRDVHQPLFIEVFFLKYLFLLQNLVIQCDDIFYF